MLTRALTGAVYVALVVAVSFLGGWYLSILFGIFTALMLYEFARMFRKSAYSPNATLLTIYGTLIYSLFTLALHTRGDLTVSVNEISLYYREAALFLIFASIIFFGVFELTSPTKNPIVNTALSVGAIIYIVPSMIMVNVLSVMGPEKVNIFPLLGIFIMIWCSDTFAYLIGRKFGKTKIAESILFNKSWEGFIGGFIFTLIAGITIAYFQDGHPFLAYSLIALVVSGFGLMGDLFESKMKRQLNLKDSGNIFPGHGGILDRFDSVLFVIPFATLVVYLFIFVLQ